MGPGWVVGIEKCTCFQLKQAAICCLLDELVIIILYLGLLNFNLLSHLMFLKFEIVTVLVLPFVTCSGCFLKDCQVVCSVNGRVKFAGPISLKHLFLISGLESQNKTLAL